MELYNENNKTVLDELYHTRVDDYSYFVHRQLKEKTEIDHCKVKELLRELDEYTVDKNISKKGRAILSKIYDQIDTAWDEEINFWQKKYYKLGFVDGMRLGKEVKEIDKQED